MPSLLDDEDGDSAMMAILPVILAGGAGTRLWPVSRETMPKHLARIIGNESLLQMTAKRVMAEAAPEGLITVAAQNQDLLIHRQLDAIDPALARHRLLEPVGRNTAAAIALAALHARKAFGDDTVLWVCPSDHLIRDQQALSQALKAALPVAARGDLLTFGIQPTRPETGYGYIKAGAEGSDKRTVRPVDRFVEKPDLKTAEAMLSEGGYLWNSGMFLLRTDRIIEELGTHEPLILEMTEQAFQVAEATEDGSLRPPLDLYEKIPSRPIDKAVMERATRISVVPCDPGWTDLGSWQAIWEEMEHDEAGNAASGDVLLHDARNCLVRGNGRLVALAGVRDLAVIETADAVLVVDRERSEPVKQVVADLNAAARSETLRHPTVDHPWGQTVLLDKGDDAEVRRLDVLPGKTIAETDDSGARHLLVTSGQAEIERGGEHLSLRAGESIDFEPGIPYRLENKGATPLQLLQVSRKL